MTQAVAKKDTQQQQVQQQEQSAKDVETQEHHASANASVRYFPVLCPFILVLSCAMIMCLTRADTQQAGLNLNLFGALSGAFSSKQKKTTHQDADGSSTTTENKHDQGTPSFPVPHEYPPPPALSFRAWNLRACILEAGLT
jgi:hypothetical protein